MRRPLVPLVILAALFLAPLVSLATAQSGGPLQLVLTSGPGEADAGGSAEAVLYLNNTGNASFTVNMTAEAPQGFSVAFSKQMQTIHPRQAETIVATVSVASDVPPGAYGVRFVADASGSVSATRAVDWRLEVRAPAQPPPPEPVAPEVAPSIVEVSGVRNRVGEYAVDVRNPAGHMQTFDVRPAYPEGWEDRGSLHNVTLAPDETKRLTFYVLPTDRAVDGAGTLSFAAGAAETRVELRMSSPPPSFTLRLSPNETTIEPNGTALFTLSATATRNMTLDLRHVERPGVTATFDTTRLVVEPGRASYAVVTVRTTQPVGTQTFVDVNATEKETGEERGAFARLRVVEAAPPPESPPPAEDDPEPSQEENKTVEEPTASPDPAPMAARLTLEVVPSTLEPAPGERVTAAVRITWTGTEGTEVALRVELPPLFDGGLETEALLLGPNATQDVALTLTPAGTLPPRATYSGRVVAASHGEGATFRIVLGATTTGPVDLELDDAAGTGPSTIVVAASLGAAGVGAGALGWVAARRKWPLALAGLYARILPARVLAHPVRARMLDEVRAEPGLTVGEVQRRLDLANGATAHHLHVLERAGHVVSVADGQQRRLFPVGAPRAAGVAPLAQRVLDALAARGPTEAGALARELGVSRQALHYHVKRLSEEGRIVVRLEGRANVLALAAPANAPRP